MPKKANRSPKPLYTRSGQLVVTNTFETMVSPPAGVDSIYTSFEEDQDDEVEFLGFGDSHGQTKRRRLGPSTENGELTFINYASFEG